MKAREEIYLTMNKLVKVKNVQAFAQISARNDYKKN